jgi:hypothetical protein
LRTADAPATLQHLSGEFATAIYSIPLTGTTTQIQSATQSIIADASYAGISALKGLNLNTSQQSASVNSLVQGAIEGLTQVSNINSTTATAGSTIAKVIEKSVLASTELSTDPKVTAAVTSGAIEAISQLSVTSQNVPQLTEQIVQAAVTQVAKSPTTTASVLQNFSQEITKEAVQSTISLTTATNNNSQVNNISQSDVISSIIGGSINALTPFGPGSTNNPNPNLNLTNTQISQTAVSNLNGAISGASTLVSITADPILMSQVIADAVASTTYNATQALTQNSASAGYSKYCCHRRRCY